MRLILSLLIFAAALAADGATGRRVVDVPRTNSALATNLLLLEIESLGTNSSHTITVENLFKTASAASTNASGQPMTNVLAGRTLWVDSVYGNNATALRGDASKPWRNVANAASNAVAGDVVKPRPGLYEETAQIFLAHGVTLASDTGDPTTTIISYGSSAAAGESCVSICSTGSVSGVWIKAYKVSGISYPIGSAIYGAHRAATNFFVRNCILEGDTDGIYITTYDTNRTQVYVEDTTFRTQWDTAVNLGPGLLELGKGCKFICNPSGSTNVRVEAEMSANLLQVGYGSTTIVDHATIVVTNGGDAIIPGGSHLVVSADGGLGTNRVTFKNVSIELAGTNQCRWFSDAINAHEWVNSNMVIRLYNSPTQVIKPSDTLTNYAASPNDGLIQMTNGPARVITLPNIGPHGRPDFDGLELAIHDFYGTATGTNIWVITRNGQSFINGPTQTNAVTGNFGTTVLGVRGTNWFIVRRFP